MVKTKPLYVALTVDTEFPTSWDDDVSARGAMELAVLSRKLDITLTWMLKVSAQEHRTVAEHFFSRIAPILPDGHEIGVHIHFDDENRENYISDPLEREHLIKIGCTVLRDFGVQPKSFRAGCCRIENTDLAVLIEEGIYIESSVAPGVIGTPHLADWQRISITEPYYLDLNDICLKGDSSILEIPLLTDGRELLFLDQWQDTDRAIAILERALARGDRFLCLLGHDGSIALDSVVRCVGILKKVEAHFLTLSGLAAAWEETISEKMKK